MIESFGLQLNDKKDLANYLSHQYTEIKTDIRKMAESFHGEHMEKQEKRTRDRTLNSCIQEASAGKGDQNRVKEGRA